ncbi:sulfite exporter TauE/SafE family protein (plasmid) [Azospirillum sp. TSA2s]|uniref:sulfite exporter TauE/SafE family protein n=1 Tax=Azospirillum sp. TSA2s TaxID=709810 RepID=UPI0010AB2130|nr:sulfite exporter TauE/SafE family protein [Azospirillum sp. TSA2s]QCG99119.1 sulfite exporter TauE/SafE family protein [Azospirillum sp. TSA2s]
MSELLTILSGSLVGFSLGLIGGGGSILAVPLLLYVVGVPDPHVAIGTSALAVAVNAFANLAQHARAGTVKWPCAATFAASGVVGAFVGSSLGKSVNGEGLLFLFALVMVVVGISMLRGRGSEGDPTVRINKSIAVRLVGIGFLTGAVSGFFGIGGGFLIVPGLLLGSGMAVINAIGSSLFSVGTFGLTTAANYALSGLVDWTVAGLFIAGGVVGGFAGMKAAVGLSTRKGALTQVFAGVLFTVAAYMLYRNVGALGLF